MLGTILSIVGGVSEAINIYKFGSTLAKGSDAERVLGALDRIHAQVERLTDNILYAPGIEGLSPVGASSHRLNGLREARALLEPVQAALGGEIVSSGLIETPDKMERAMLENPWAVLEDIRPQHLAVRQANPDKVPVLFMHNGVRYIGWQMRGVLPVLFNCELRDLPGLGASLTPDVGGRARQRQSGQSPVSTAKAGSWGGDRSAVPSVPAQPLKAARLVRTFSGHARWVDSVAFSPDANLALSGSWDNTLKLWDIQTGKAIRTFHGHTMDVRSVAFSPDGRFALSGSHDDTLKLWDVQTGQAFLTFVGHKSRVLSVAFAPNGRFVLSGSSDKTLKLWDVQSGKALRKFSGHTMDVQSVAFSPDANLALSGSWDNTLKLWDIQTGKAIRSFTGHAGGVNCVGFSFDGRFAVSGSSDKTLKLWDVQSGKALRTFTHSSALHSVVFSPNGRHIGSTRAKFAMETPNFENGGIKLWNAHTGRELFSQDFPGTAERSIAFSPDGRFLLSGGEDNTLKLWDISEWTQA